MKKILMISMILACVIGMGLLVNGEKLNAKTDVKTDTKTDVTTYVTTYASDNASQPIMININGEKIESDVHPVIINNSVIVPIRVVAEKLGAKIGWDSAKNQATLEMENMNLVLVINNINARVNGMDVKMPAAPQNINGRTMVPLRFIAENFNMNVEWNPKDRTVAISKRKVIITGFKITNENGKFEVKVHANGVITDFSKFEEKHLSTLNVELTDVFIDYKNFEPNIVKKISESQFELDVQSNFVKKISVFQKDANIGKSSVVLDMKAWTNYEVKLSADKKELIIELDNTIPKVENIAFEQLSSSDEILVNMKYERQPIISSNERGKIFVDIPLASGGNPVVLMEKPTDAGKAGLEVPMDTSKMLLNIVAMGNFVESVENQQIDSSTVRLIVKTFANCVVETRKNEDSGGFALSFSSLASKGMAYENLTSPKFTISSEKVNNNYYNYKFHQYDDKFVFSTPLAISGIEDGKVFINDKSVSYIEIHNSPKLDAGSSTVGNLIAGTAVATIAGKATSGKEIIIHTNDATQFRVDSIHNYAKLVVEAVPVNILTKMDTNKKIREKLIILDAGHGGKEPGAVAGSVYEKDLNLDIVLKLNKLLTDDGFKVVMTREDDRDVELYSRPEKANKLGAELFVSVHNNGGAATENGTMSLFYPGVFESVYGMSGERIAQITQEEMINALGTKDLGVWKRPRLVVIKASVMPSVLAEVAYVSNPADLQKLITSDFRGKAADALYKAIVEVSQKEMVSEQDNMRKGYDVRNISGFNIPPKALAKCEYGGSTRQNPSMYDLTIQLDYAKDRNKTATLEEQFIEAKEVLKSKLDESLINKIMASLATFKGFDSIIWAGDDGELNDKNYLVQVKCLRYSGKIDIQVNQKQVDEKRVNQK